MKIWIKYVAMPDNGLPKPMINHYKSLPPDAVQTNKNSRMREVYNSANTMDIRYRNLTDLVYNSILYNSMLNDIDRKIITRWRLSSHQLHIETGRYKRPRVTREERKCLVCDTLEDEHHALFVCFAHSLIRTSHQDLIIKFNCVKDILNPSTVEDVKLVAVYLRAIEDNMKHLKMTR